MDMNLLILFIVLNVVNVIIQTIKSLCTIKCGKVVAALVNALAYGLYTIVLVYTVCDLPLYVKVAVVALANFIGVFTVKYIEEKMRKDRLWKIEATFKNRHILDDLKEIEVPHNYIDANKYYIVNFYCSTQKDSALVKEFIVNNGGKYFATETKIL